MAPKNNNDAKSLMGANGKSYAPSSSSGRVSSETIDERILRLLGLENELELSYEEYVRHLKEALSTISLGKSRFSTEEAVLFQTEFKRVKSKNKEDRFKVKKKKISASDIGLKKSSALVKTSKVAAPSKLSKTVIKPKLEKPIEKAGVAGDKSIVDNLKSINKTLDKVLKSLVGQGKDDKKRREKDKSSSEKGKAQERESDLEKPFQVVRNLANKIIQPFRGILDSVFRFIGFTFAGWLVGKFEEIQKWTGQNKGKIEVVKRFLKDWWPSLAVAAGLFLTPLGGFIRGTLKLLRVFIPQIARILIANPWIAGVALVTTAGAVGIAQKKEKEEALFPEKDKDGNQIQKTTKQRVSELQQKANMQVADPMGAGPIGSTFNRGGSIPGIQKAFSGLVGKNTGMPVSGFGKDTQAFGLAGGGTAVLQPGEAVLQVGARERMINQTGLDPLSFNVGPNANKPRNFGYQDGGIVGMQGGGILGALGGLGKAVSSLRNPFAGGPSLMPGAGGRDGGVNPLKNPKAWFGLGENTRIPNERAAKFGNPLDYFKKNPDPTTLFGDDALQRGMSNPAFKAGEKPGLIGNPIKALTGIDLRESAKQGKIIRALANQGGPGSGPTPITRQIVKRLAPRLAGAARLSSPIGLGIEGGQLLGNMGIEYGKRRDKEKEAQQQFYVNAITGQSNVSGQPAQLTQTKPRGFGENIQHAIHQSKNFLSGISGKQGGGSIGTPRIPKTFPGDPDFGRGDPTYKPKRTLEDNIFDSQRRLDSNQEKRNTNIDNNITPWWKKINPFINKPYNLQLPSHDASGRNYNMPGYNRDKWLELNDFRTNPQKYNRKEPYYAPNSGSHYFKPGTTAPLDLQGGGMVGMPTRKQGGGFLDTLGRFLPGTGNVMSPLTYGPKDLRGNRQTDPGFQSKFMGMNLGKRTSGPAHSGQFSDPAAYGGVQGGYSDAQKKRYMGMTGGKFALTSYAGSTIMDRHLKYPGFPSLQNKNNQIPDYMMPPNTSKPQQQTRQPSSPITLQNNQSLNLAIKNARDITNMPGGAVYKPLVESAINSSMKAQERYDNLRNAMREAGMSGADENMNMKGNIIKKQGGGAAARFMKASNITTETGVDVPGGMFGADTQYIPSLNLALQPGEDLYVVPKNAVPEMDTMVAKFDRNSNPAKNQGNLKGSGPRVSFMDLPPNITGSPKGSGGDSLPGKPQIKDVDVLMSTPMRMRVAEHLGIGDLV